METLQPGDPGQIGRYRLLRRLGSGGMGRVFLGQSPGGRLVAVKVIRAELADSPDFRSRFAREVAAARKVSGIFTAPVVDADPDAAQPWLVTGYVDGPSLAAAVDEHGPLPAGPVLALAAGLAEGLGAIHAAGVVHRDLKPSNIVLAADGPRIIDFGISRAAGATPVTQTGMVMGSPGFMSPEQATGHAAGPPSDIFSLGAALAFAATGREPFGEGSAPELVYRVVHAAPSLDGVTGRLRALIESCLAKDPGQRPGTDDVLAMLGTVQPAVGWLPWPVASPSQAPDMAGAGQPGITSDQAPHPVTAPAGDVGPLALPARSRPRRRAWLTRAVVAVGVVAVGASVAAFALRTGGTALPRPPRHSSSAAASRPEPTGAATTVSSLAVVEAYFTAINQRAWPTVWRLGGRNLGIPYNKMIAGFQYTHEDVITSITTDATAVSVRFLAYETTGAVQTYTAHYTVRAGAIVSASQTLTGTRYPSASAAPPANCPHISYGADGNAGPLFCSDGRPDPPVLAYFQQMHLRVLQLGINATPDQVLRAMCADLQHHSTYPIETSAYDLAQRLNGWSFGIDPVEEMKSGACGG